MKTRVEGSYIDWITNLEMVDEDEMSQRKGAQRLDTSRTTIRRALEDEERRQLYNLD